MGKFIHIRSKKFPVQSGEDDEIINDGMYGKALAKYLQEQLAQRGYVVPFVCAEDWGWWVELDTSPIRSGICIYALPESSDPIEYVCSDGFTSDRNWSWAKFRFIDTRQLSSKIYDDLVQTFQSDQDVQIVEVSDEFPF